MAETTTRSDHKKQLETLYNYLDHDGWDVNLQPPADDNPYDLIAVKIFSDDDEVLWTAELSFLPIPAAELPDSAILQCFIPLANNFPSLLKTELYAVITRLNTKMPLGGFGFLEPLNLLFYKHSMMLAAKPDTGSGLVVSQSLNLITYLISTFTMPIVDTASGEITVDDAVNALIAQGLFN